ncbi:MAG TPA: hypothetical protein VNZ49_12605, partial [Bacteroidia bacterium]|nr:hypothetical protein [Bacteroidia bacterium]
LDSAKICIDSVALNPQTRKEFNVWMVRGFIYKDLYKIKEADKAVSPLRDAAIESFRKSLQLDSANANPQREGILKGMKYIASTYHNDINKTLDTINYQISLTNAEKYLVITKFLDPSFKENIYNFDVYLTIGSMFEKEYEHHRSKNNLDQAKAYLFKAYDIDSISALVNKNLGLLYYNQAVEIINSIDPDTPLDQIDGIQDRAVKLAKQAKSYCLKAHKVNPKDKVVIEALMGIYYLLNEMEQYNYYKKLLEELNKQ